MDDETRNTILNEYNKDIRSPPKDLFDRVLQKITKSLETEVMPGFLKSKAFKRRLSQKLK